MSLCLVLGLARAQDNEPYEADPPDRAARLSFLEGDVSMQPAGEEQWAPAILNRPLTTGDKLWTEQDSRAEIEVGQAAVRLDGDTGFSFLNIDDSTIQMRMTAGVINVRVRALTDEQIEIATPNVALSILRPGNYRIEVNEPGDVTVVKVSEGEAEATRQGQSVVVRDQQVATFRGLDRLAAQFDVLGASDEFDSWNQERDRRYFLATPSQSIEYVSPEVTGYEDLDDHGTWSAEPEYGYVWTPSRVAADWSPYRYGRWLWVRPWGWTWIDDAPWGYAPFHYGRWAHVRSRWCWVPGPRHVRPVYAPALVGWVGTPRTSYSGSFAGVAWFPLGPREVYVPGRRFSPRYVERVNVSNSTIISRAVVHEVYENRARNITFRNRVVPGAVTAVSRTAFTSSERVGNHRIRVNEQEFTRAHATSMAPQIAPLLESRLGGAVRANVRTPPQTIVDRQVVVRRNPPPAAANLVRSTTGHVNTPRATAVSEAFNRMRTERTPRAQLPAPERRAEGDPPRDARAVRPQQDRERARDQQQRREAEIRQRHVQMDAQQQRQREQRQQQQHRENAQRQPDAERRAAPRPVEQRERNVERPRVEPRQQEARPSRPAVQRPTESRPPKQRDDQPRAHRN
ncbi:MAG TPA: DUF6600 domain-containing protein [Steroidobacteraceae bacterium]|nr:DUF6600 domain-containing protein [Steroidobacteraceae bacterium]